MKWASPAGPLTTFFYGKRRNYRSRQHQRFLRRPRQRPRAALPDANITLTTEFLCPVTRLTRAYEKDLATLVAINTENPPGHEREAAECLEGWLLTAGFDLSFSEYAPGRTNVIAVLHNGPGPCFAFNTHIDTVPAGSGWTAIPSRSPSAMGACTGAAPAMPKAAGGDG